MQISPFRLIIPLNISHLIERSVFCQQKNSRMNSCCFFRDHNMYLSYSTMIILLSEYMLSSGHRSVIIIASPNSPKLTGLDTRNLLLSQSTYGFWACFIAHPFIIASLISGVVNPDVRFTPFVPKKPFVKLYYWRLT